MKIIINNNKQRNYNKKINKNYYNLKNKVQEILKEISTVVKYSRSPKYPIYKLNHITNIQIVKFFFDHITQIIIKS